MGGISRQLEDGISRILSKNLDRTTENDRRRVEGLPPTAEEEEEEEELVRTFEID